MRAEELEGKRIYLPYGSGATCRVDKVAVCPGHHSARCDIVELEVTTDGAEQTYTITAVKGEDFAVASTTYSVIGVWVDDQPVVAGVVEGVHVCVDNPSGRDEALRWATVVTALSPDEAEVEAVREVASR